MLQRWSSEIYEESVKCTVGKNSRWGLKRRWTRCSHSKQTLNSPKKQTIDVKVERQSRQQWRAGGGIYFYEFFRLNSRWKIGTAGFKTTNHSFLSAHQEWTQLWEQVNHVCWCLSVSFIGDILSPAAAAGHRGIPCRIRRVGFKHNTSRDV